MRAQISDALFVQLNEFLASHMGLHFPKYRRTDLEQGIALAARELGFEDTEKWVQELISLPMSQQQIELLSSYLTIGETYFFRDKQSFEVLEQHILPELINSRRSTDNRHLRIWSAGCCTGEEPYSLAILLCKLIPDLEHWQITILGTDINTTYLGKANAGLYGEWSFRSTPRAIRDRFFKEESKDQYRIVPQVKQMVHFSYLNLVEDVYPSLMNSSNAMDIVLCRNVLIYFTPKHIKSVINKLYRSLADNGWLIVSATETSQTLFSDFSSIIYPGTIVYKKDHKRSKSSSSILTSPASPVFSMPIADEDYAKITKVTPLNTVPISPPKTTYQELLPSTPPVEEPIATTTPYDAALSLYNLGHYTEAADKLSELFLQGGLQEPAGIILMTRALANQGSLPQALEWCQRAILVDKLNPACYYLKATILNEQGSITEAMESLKQALYLDPNLVVANFSLGNLLRRQGKHQQASKYFKTALLLLKKYDQQNILPESDGITAGRLEAVIASMIDMERVR